MTDTLSAPCRTKAPLTNVVAGRHSVRPSRLNPFRKPAFASQVSFLFCQTETTLVRIYIGNFFFDFSIEPHGPWLKSDVPTVIGLGVGMSVFMALTCLVLRLFSRARFAQDQARGYGNAHLAPPTSTSTTINHTHTGL